MESFEAHPGAEIITSFPGLGSLTGEIHVGIGPDRPAERPRRRDAGRPGFTG